MGGNGDSLPSTARGMGVDVNILENLAERRVIPVVVLEKASDASGVGDALVAGGLPVAEVTFRTDAAVEAIGIFARRGDLLVGAGTVITPSQVDQAADVGASFIVTPGFSAAVVEQARKRNLAIIPGVATATDIMSALSMGIETVKFFPASTAGGIPAIKALAAPFKQVKFVPTGGVSLSNLAEYLSIPAVLAVGGSWMVPAKTIQVGDFETVRRLTAEAVAAVEAFNKEV